MSLAEIEEWEIKLAASYSQAAYGDSIPNGFRYDSKLGATAFYVRHQDHQWIVHRGTTDVKDWVINAQAWPWRVGGRWVHAGFALSQRSVWKELRKHLNPKVRTYCVGHSLGGGNATISALRLAQEGFDDIRLITAGRPNVFWKSEKTMKGLTCNISLVAGSDIVATVPRVFYGCDGAKAQASSQDIIYFANTGEDFLNPDKSFRDEDRRANLKEIVSDHMMETSYTPRIEKMDMEKLCQST